MKLDTHEYRNLPVYYGLNPNGCRTSARQNCTRQAEWFENLPRAEGPVRKDPEQSRTRRQTCGMKLDTHEYRNLPVYSGLNLSRCRTSARQNCTCQAEWFENLPSAEGPVRKDPDQEVKRAGRNLTPMSIGTYLFILGLIPMDVGLARAKTILVRQTGLKINQASGSFRWRRWTGCIGAQCKPRDRCPKYGR
jgi:hypothetical protein